jgi:uncharacterized protein involved in tolerance to divalent cations
MMANEFGINYWDSKNKNKRTPQRYYKTFTKKADALAEAFAFFSPYEVARVVEVDVAKGKPPTFSLPSTVVWLMLWTRPCRPD